MPDDTLLPQTPVVSEGPSGLTMVEFPTAKRSTCEFCGCVLAPNGDVMEMSDRAKKMRDQKDKLDAALAELAEAHEELSRCRVSIDTLSREAQDARASVKKAQGVRW